MEEPQLAVRSYSPARPKLGEASPHSDDQGDPVGNLASLCPWPSWEIGGRGGDH